MRSCGAYFLEKMQKRKSVFRLHRPVRIACEPIPCSAQGDPKIKEKTSKVDRKILEQSTTNMHEHVDLCCFFEQADVPQVS